MLGQTNENKCHINNNRQRRFTTAHVETETVLWQYGMNLILEMESVSSDMLGEALFPFQDASRALWSGTATVAATSSSSTEGPAAISKFTC